MKITKTQQCKTIMGRVGSQRNWNYQRSGYDCFGIRTLSKSTDTRTYTLTDANIHAHTKQTHNNIPTNKLTHKQLHI